MRAPRVDPRTAYSFERDGFLATLAKNFEADLFALPLSDIPTRTDRFCAWLDVYIDYAEGLPAKRRMNSVRRARSPQDFLVDTADLIGGGVGGA